MPICHTKNRKRSLKQHIKYFTSGEKFSWTTLYNSFQVRL